MVGIVIRVLCGRYFRGCIVSVGYVVAHPRLNPVGILPPGSRPSDVHSDDGYREPVGAYVIRPYRHNGFRGVVGQVDAMTCEACEAETQARLIARGKQSATPGCHHRLQTRRPYRTEIIWICNRSAVLFIILITAIPT